MNRAIKNHVAKHKQADNGLVLDSLEDSLTEQILIAVIKMSMPKCKLVEKTFQGLPKYSLQ
jgi:hypothetical protein